MKIAILITCFNRKNKTLACLKSLYAQVAENQIEVFIVDGGSNDGTIEAVNRDYPSVRIKRIDGLFWAGGMRAAWKMADEAGTFDFYLLLNDDTTLKASCLAELLKTEAYCIEKYKKPGICVGATCNEVGNYTYGGIKLDRLNHTKGRVVAPTGNPQPIDLANANIMLVPTEIYKAIGGFCEVYTHGCADYDYSLRVRHSGFPVLLSPGFLGVCEDDHGRNWMPQRASLRKRINYLYSPKGLQYHDYLYYIKTFFPSEYYSAKAKLWLKTLFPFIWSVLKKERN